MRHGHFRASRLVDLSRLSDLKQIEQQDGQISLGALLTYNDLLSSSVVLSEAPALAQAAATVGCAQTRNRGTLGGNLANASPAGDTLPPLLILDAHALLAGASGERTLPLAEFLQGPGQTALQSGEIIQKVRFERLPPEAKSLFLKLGSRQGMAVSIASAAVALRVDDRSRVLDVRIALGAVAPTGIRCGQAEQTLLGQTFSEDLVDLAARCAANECSPIDDVRGSAEYRRHAVFILVRRALLSVFKSS